MSVDSKALVQLAEIDKGLDRSEQGKPVEWNDDERIANDKLRRLCGRRQYNEQPKIILDHAIVFVCI